MQSHMGSRWSIVGLSAMPRENFILKELWPLTNFSSSAEIAGLDNKALRNEFVRVEIAVLQGSMDNDGHIFPVTT